MSAGAPDAAMNDAVEHATPMLVDLDTEILSEILCWLPAKAQGMAMCTCKLAWLLLAEVQRDAAQATFLRSTVKAGKELPKVENSLVLEAGTDELAPELSAPPTMGLLFTTPSVFTSTSKRQAALARLVRRLPPAMHLVGGEVDTLLGTRTDGAMATVRGRGYALTLGGFPEAPTSSFVVDARNAAAEAAQLTDQGALQPGWRVMVVLSCGSGVHRLESVLQRLQTTHPEAAIIGGLATGEWLLRAHAGQLRILRNGLVGLMFRGNVPLRALVVKGQGPAILTRLKQAQQEVADTGQTLLGGLMFTCTARDAAADAAAFSMLFPGTPLAGMPCNGEIGPRFRPMVSGASSGASSGAEAFHAGEVSLQGFTAVYGLFSVPKRTRAPADVYYEDVGSAYAQGRQRPECVATAAAAVAAAAVAAAAAAAGEAQDDDDGDDGQDGWHECEEEGEEEGEEEEEDLYFDDEEGEAEDEYDDEDEAEDEYDEAEESKQPILEVS